MTTGVISVLMQVLQVGSLSCVSAPLSRPLHRYKDLYVRYEYSSRLRVLHRHFSTPVLNRVQTSQTMIDRRGDQEFIKILHVAMVSL